MNITEAIVLAVEKVKAWIQSGGVKWDHVSDKPFVKVGGDTLTWDGNTEGLVSVDFTALNGSIYYKVSDAVLTMDNFANGLTIVFNNGAGATLTADDVMAIYDGVISTDARSFFAIAEEAAGVNNDGAVFPESGVYFMFAEDETGSIHVSSLTIPGYTGFAKEQIDPAVLPEYLQPAEKTVTIFDGTPEFFDMDGIFGAVIEHEAVASMFPGDTIHIEWDGTTYEYPVSAIGIENAFAVSNAFFGNMILLTGVDTGEPFFIMKEGGALTVIAVSATEAPSPNVKIIVNLSLKKQMVAYTVNDVDANLVRLSKVPDDISQVYGGMEFVNAVVEGRSILIFSGTQRARPIIGVDVGEAFSKGVEVTMFSGLNGNGEVTVSTAYTAPIHSPFPEE